MCQTISPSEGAQKRRIRINLMITLNIAHTDHHFLVFSFGLAWGPSAHRRRRVHASLLFWRSVAQLAQELNILSFRSCTKHEDHTFERSSNLLGLRIQHPHAARSCSQLILRPFMGKAGCKGASRPHRNGTRHVLNRPAVPPSLSLSATGGHLCMRRRRFSTGMPR